jgi:hypothetical protein
MCPSADEAISVDVSRHGWMAFGAAAVVKLGVSSGGFRQCVVAMDFSDKCIDLQAEQVFRSEVHFPLSNRCLLGRHG